MNEAAKEKSAAKGLVYKEVGSGRPERCDANHTTL